MGQGAEELIESIECQNSRIEFKAFDIYMKEREYNEYMELRNENLEIAKENTNKFVIINEDDKYLIDRRKTKEGWWCGLLRYALILNSRKAMEDINSKYTKKNTKVLQLNYKNILEIENKMNSKLKYIKEKLEEDKEFLPFRC